MANRCFFSFFIFILVQVIVVDTALAARGKVSPYEMPGDFVAVNKIDECILASLKAKGIQPAKLCSDAVFVRRVYIDVLGILPEPWQVREFLGNKSKDKRSRLIDELLEKSQFADYWSLKWCDVLRVKAEFPINLWPNAVQAYHRWLHDALGSDMGYDQFARELLTSSGSNFRHGQVNFYRAIQGHQPSAIASAVALTFLGERIEMWPDEKRKGFEKFFSKVSYKSTAEWKEEIVYLNPEANETIKARFPDGSTVTIAGDQDPREVFARWLIAKDNPWFARTIVNRIWYWFMGRGIIHDPDDIRVDNSPVNPGLLTFLEKELVNADYDMKHIYRLILNSRTYQQSPIPISSSDDARKYFACYPVHRLDAEVLIDALCWISGSREQYFSDIPEPFTFIPKQRSTVELIDGSITSQFLEMFGRPSRDTGLLSERNNQPSDSQSLHLLNSTHIQGKIDKSWRIKRLIRTSGKNRPKLIRQIYLTILSRYPTRDEIEVFNKYLKDSDVNGKQGVIDLVWALINSKEFLYCH